MSFNIYNILIITGIIQGFVFTGIVIYAKKYHSRSTFFLVSLILCYSINNLIYILPDIGAMSLLTMYAYLFLPFASIIAPIIYFYVIYFLYPTRKISTKEKLLFVPFLIFLCLILLFRFRIIFGYDQIDQINIYYFYTITYHELFSIIYSAALLVVTLIQIKKFKKQNILYDKNQIHGSIRWLKVTLYIIFLFTALWGYLAVKNIYFTNGKTIFYSLWIAMAALIYWLGHIGIYKYGIIKERLNIRTQSLSNEETEIRTATKNCHILDFENLLIKEKAYLDSNLSLESVAENLKISPSYLSRIINYDLNTSFSEYVHRLRVKEAQGYLSNPEFSDYTMVSIGLEAGFNSKSAFFSTFKLATGKTPLKYKKEYFKN